jgi:methyl-accepting chemotaxis protein
MDDMTQQNASLVEESAAASRAMQDQSNALMDLIGYFKLGQGSSANAAQNTFAASQRAVTHNAPAPINQSRNEANRPSSSYSTTKASGSSS